MGLNEFINRTPLEQEISVKNNAAILQDVLAGGLAVYAGLELGDEIVDAVTAENPFSARGLAAGVLAAVGCYVFHRGSQLSRTDATELKKHL